MGSDVGQIFPTASLHRDHSILYVLVCEKRLTLWYRSFINDDVCQFGTALILIYETAISLRLFGTRSDL